MATTTNNRLTNWHREQLLLAARTGKSLGLYFPDGEGRYDFYLRKGYSHEDAFHYALVWTRNAAEQKERRAARY